ncbi:MAG: hypothetical protein R3Y13_04970 [bacterium]
MNKELKWVKKNYSENMMQLCRELFPTILEEENILKTILVKTFYNHRCLAEDLISNDKKDDFKNFIFSYYNEMHNEESVEDDINYDIEELLKNVNYNFFKVETNEELEKFKKYYIKEEILCTFNSNRLKHSDIYFLIKNNVETIKRSNKPNKEDDYSTSVLCVQFSKGTYNNISIISRYNHSVENPNATYGNNLELICKNLTNAFISKYKYNVPNIYRKYFEMPRYIQKNGKYYKYNVESNGIYYCIDNITLGYDGEKHYDKSKYILMETFLLSLSGEGIKILNCNKNFMIPDKNETFKVNVKNEVDKDHKKIKIITLKDKRYEEDSVFIINDSNQIISIDMPNLVDVEDFFSRQRFDKLKCIKLKNVKSVSMNFLNKCYNLEEIYMPNLEHVDSGFIRYNNLKKISLPSLKTADDYFLYDSKYLEEVDLPSLKKVESDFMYKNIAVKKIDLPNIKEVGNNFLVSAVNLKWFRAEKLEKIQNNFLKNNESLIGLNIKNVRTIGNYFLSQNLDLPVLELPLCEEVGMDFLPHNIKLKKCDLSYLKKAGMFFMIDNHKFNSDYIINRNVKNELKNELKKRYTILEYYKNKIKNNFSNESVEKNIKNK